MSVPLRWPLRGSSRAHAGPSTPEFSPALPNARFLECGIILTHPAAASDFVL